MKNMPGTTPNRRELIRSLSRNITLAGIGIFAGWLILGNSSSAKCKKQSLCRHCRQLKECRRPLAHKTREALERP